MASGKSAYLRNEFLNLALGADSWTPPVTLYVALSTSAWSAALTGTTLASSEPSGGSYARVSITNDTTTWPTATLGVKSNGIDIQFPSATGSWGTVLSFYLVDAASNGNILFGGDLFTSRTIISGDTPKFATGSLTVTET